MLSCAPYRCVIHSLYIARWTACTWTHQVPLFLHHLAYRWGKRRLCPVLVIAFSRWPNLTWRCVSASSLRWLTAGCCLHRHVCPLLTVPHRFSAVQQLWKEAVYLQQPATSHWLTPGQLTQARKTRLLPAPCVFFLRSTWDPGEGWNHSGVRSMLWSSALDSCLIKWIPLSESLDILFSYFVQHDKIVVFRKSFFIWICWEKQKPTTRLIINDNNCSLQDQFSLLHFIISSLS